MRRQITTHGFRFLFMIRIIFLLSLAAGITLAANPAAALNRAEGALPADKRASTSQTPRPPLTKHGLVAIELRRWPARGANQGVAVDGRYFFGIGNAFVGKFDKTSGERVAEWTSPAGGPIVHLNGGHVEAGVLVLAHSNYPQLPMASSLEYFDIATLRPVKTFSLGIRPGSLTWAERKDGAWWACFANYNGRGGTPGLDQRWTFVGKFDDRWQMIESWLFPPQVIATWGRSSCSGGSWADDGFLYTTGHDAKELYVLRLPKMGVMLEYVTTIDVPFEGQSWAWDRSEKRVIYGITRKSGEVVVARIPEVPGALRRP